MMYIKVSKDAKVLTIPLDSCLKLGSVSVRVFPVNIPSR